MEKEESKIIHSSFWSNIFKTPGENIDLQESLQAMPPFRSLTKKDLNLLFNIVHNRNYIADEHIFYQGDPGIGLYIIRDGEVKIERSNEAGTIISLATIKRGDFFGELAMIDGEKRSASAIAKTDCRLSVIFKPDLDDFINKYPRKGIKILAGISEIIAIRLRQLNEDHIAIQSKLLINSEGNYGT